jgi:hypothetical protein
LTPRESGNPLKQEEDEHRFFENLAKSNSYSVKRVSIKVHRELNNNKRKKTNIFNVGPLL